MIEIDGILFDMDGVLLDSMPAHADAWMRALGELGLDAVGEEEIYRREGEKGEVSARDFLRTAGLMPTRARVRRLLDRKEELFKHSKRIAPFTAARATVEALAATGMPMGLVTGTSLAEVEDVLPGELREPMAVVVTGDQVLHGKPHPEPYLKAILALGTRPGRTLVVENAPFGIRSALDAEAVCLAIRSYLPDKYLADAHYRIDDIGELLSFLRENVSGFADG